MKQISYLLPIILASFLTTSLPQKSVPEKPASDTKALIGEYIYSTGFVGAAIKILGDGRYEYSTFSDCCDPVWRELGTYVLTGNLLHFRITTKTLNEYNMLDPKQATEGYRTVYKREYADARASEIRTEYDMYVVRWGERIYLLEPDGLPLFAALVNFGIEPRRGIIIRNYLPTDFFLRFGDMDKPVVGKPELPEPWSSFMNASPIKAAVTKIESQDKERIYTVNKGTGDGVKVGMYFVGENTEPDYDNLLLVISVEEGSATLKSSAIFRAADYQLGSILVTKMP